VYLILSCGILKSCAFVLMLVLQLVTKYSSLTPQHQVSDVLEQWVALQRAWMYLEPVFASSDIQQQLPMEAKRFAAVDRGWRKTLEATRRAPGVIKVRADSRTAGGSLLVRPFVCLCWVCTGSLLGLLRRC
jgi:hypothetical protein